MTWVQQIEKPLFPDLIWSRPQNKRQAGKLLIIGGQIGQVTEVSKAYNASQKAGAGHIRVLLPESLHKVTQHLPDIEYAPSNSSGSFARQSLAVMNELTEWSDAVFLAGGMGKNSETTTVIDGYLLRCPSLTTLSEDAFSTISLPFDQLLSRNTVSVLSFPMLQKKAEQLNSPQALTSTAPLQTKAEIISSYTKDQAASIVTIDQEQVWASQGNKASSTKTTDIEHTTLAAYCSVWAMQFPNKKFEALTTAIFEASQPSASNR